LFVCAIGVPPKPVVDKLHAAGIPVMNVSNHPLVILCTDSWLLRWLVTLSMLPRLLLSVWISSAHRAVREEAYVLHTMTGILIKLDYSILAMSLAPFYSQLALTNVRVKCHHSLESLWKSLLPALCMTGEAWPPPWHTDVLVSGWGQGSWRAPKPLLLRNTKTSTL
jgi:hypothetical protein